MASGSTLVDADGVVQAGTVPVREPDAALFDYRPVPVIAIVGCVLGILSALSLLGATGILVAILGAGFSAVALIRILLARGQLGGKTAAAAGLLLSLGFGVGGAWYQWYLYTHEVPAGFQRVSFSEDISRKGFIREDGQTGIPDEVHALVGKPIFLKGFMYPTEQMTGLKSFLLVKDSDQCCFGGQPAREDMIGVVMTGEEGVDFYPGRVSVAGEFELNLGFTGQDNLEPVYLLQGKIVTPSRTAF